MSAEARSGVSGYIEVFILIGVAAAATAFVFGAVSPYASSLQGPSVTVSDAAIRQGTYLALETLTVYNSGGPAATGFTLTTAAVPSAASYCYSLVSPTTMSTLSSTCPSATSNPGIVVVSWPLPPGGSILVEITITGTAFTVGSSYQVTVTTTAGSQATVGVQATPA